MPDPDSLRRYWRANLRLVTVLLAIWFAVAYLGGIVFTDVLDRVSLFNVPLGFWIAQQGSLICFVAIIVTYAVLMNRIDREHGLEERESSGETDDKADPAGH